MGRAPKPIEYDGRQFPSRWALAEYLAPLLGRNVTTISVRLSRYDGDIAKVAARQNRGMGRAPKPIEYDGRQFPSRRALAEYLSPRLGRSVTTLKSLLSRYDGDIAKVVREHPQRRPMEFEGVAFPTRRALAQYLAPRMDRPALSVERLLVFYNDDVAAVLRTRRRPRRPAAAAEQHPE